MPIGGLIAVIIGVIVAGAVATSTVRESADTIVSANQVTGAPPENENRNVSHSTTAIHPVSIPALIEMELDGRDLKLGAVQADNASYTRYSITYKSGLLTISGIMNVPKGAGPFPVLFLNHGYIDPDVYTNGRGLKREQDYLARQGFVVLHSDYRCHAESDCEPADRFEQRLGYVKDAMNAVQAIRHSNDPRFDKEKIGMLGHSMGGGVAINVMVAKPDLVDAIVLFAPVSSDIRDSYARWTTSRPAEAEQIVKNYGSAEQNPEFWNNLSARNFLDRIQAPIMNHHGTADASVPLEWSDRLNTELLTAKKSIIYHTYPGQPHEFTSAWGTVMQRTTAFFTDHLK